MNSVKLRSTFINGRTQMLPYRLDDATHGAVEEYMANYNPTAGPVRKVITYFPATAAMPVYVGHCEYFDLDYVLQRLVGTTSLDTGVSKSLFAGGKGYDLPGMFLSSVGETIERVLASLFYFGEDERRRYGTYLEMTDGGLPCLHPDDVPLFAAEQYAEPNFVFEPFTEQSYLGWVEGTRLRSGEKVWVPAQLVELVYTRRREEAMIGYAVSGGLTSHVNKTLALFHGITELIERDAVNLHWYCRIPPKRIVFDRPPAPALRRLLGISQSLPGDIDFYVHCIDFPEVPVITAIEVDPWLNRYSYYSGGGADLDIDVSLIKALNEFGQSERTTRLALISPTRSFAVAVGRLFEMGPDEPVSKIDLFFKVVSFYGWRKNAEKLDWYRKEGETVQLSELPVTGDRTTEEKLALLVEVLAAHGIDPIVFDLTPPGMHRLKLMKVFIPELTQPFVQSSPYFGHPRFKQAGMMVGQRDGEMPLEELLTDPLPYP